MASPSSSDRAKCKHNKAGEVCRCQEWDPSEGDESLCECCTHHMSFHEPRHPNEGPGRCLNKCDDGCQEFYPRAFISKVCAGCGCHRSWHEGAVVPAREQLARSSNVPNQQGESSIQASSKKRKLDHVIISTNVDEDEEATRVGGGVDMECEDGVPEGSGTASVDSGLQHGRGLDNDTTRIRDELQPKHKIFLSHSGFQKSFVEQLCVDLERTDRYSFFDKRRDSLPVGKKFPKLLFSAIQQCEVGVVVLSKEFFIHSKWPMLELVEMVRASEGVQSSINIVPVFYNISREECRDEGTQRGWRRKWEEWAKRDLSINIDEWMKTLRIFGSTTGLVLRNSREEVPLRSEVVEAVCKLVLPESGPDDSNVEGKDRLCKIVLDKIESNCRDSRNGARIVGLYGVGGIGKTTICKVLLNKSLKKFCGKACHIEMKSTSNLELFRKLLKYCTITRHDLLDKMDIDECLDQLKRCIVKQPIFLALDNVDEDSSSEARMYLEATHSFAHGSVVVVTSRSLAQLKALNIPEDDCLGMPELEQPEARNIFKSCITSNVGPMIKLDDIMIDLCVKVCFLKRGDGTNHHYHPLALKVLGNVLREEMGQHNIDSKEFDAKVSALAKSHELLETKKQVFSILRISYDTLSLGDQLLFMDVALFVTPKTSFDLRNGPNLFEWLGTIHGHMCLDAIKMRLESLKKKSLLESVGDGSTPVGIHDLWYEFCIAEIKVEDFADRRCVYDDEDCKGLGESSPSGRCWEKLERMYFTSKVGMHKFLGLQLDHFANLKVLKVVVFMNSVEVMNPMEVDFGKLPHLKHLKMGGFCNFIKVCGLRSLSNLAYLSWRRMPDDNVCAEDIGFLRNLQFLDLSGYQGQRLPDMSKLTSLQVAKFTNCREVKAVIGLSLKLTRLRSLNLSGCENLQSYPYIDDLISLEFLDLSYCDALEELPYLGRLTNLKELVMHKCSFLMTCKGLSGLRDLQKVDIFDCAKLRTLPTSSSLVSWLDLDLRWCKSLAFLTGTRVLHSLNLQYMSIGTLDLSPFPQLEVLKQNHCLSLTSLRCSVSLPALKELDLAGCEQLEALPDLCNFVNLTYLGLSGCSSLVCLTNVGTFHKLEHLDLSSCKSMVMLDLAPFPQLKHLDLKDCTSLTSLKCGVPLLAHYWLDLSGCEQLEALDLAGCEQLKRLDLSNCKSMIMLDLTPFPQLEELKLGHCLSLTSLRCSVSLPALKELDLAGCEQLEALPDLCNFVNLTYLFLSGCSSLVCLPNVGTLHKLEHLDLLSCKSLIMLDLTHFPQLEELKLGQCLSLTSLRCNVSLPAIKELNLAGCGQLEALPDLCNFVNLTYLSLSDCSSLVCLTNVGTFHKLEHLNLSSCKSMVMLDLAPFPQLKHLGLTDCTSLTSLKCGVSLPALKEHDLAGFGQLEALPDLCNFVNLTYLGLSGCSSLVCLTNVGTFHKLEHLDLSSCKSMVMLDLAPFPQLRGLYLMSCTSLTSLKCGTFHKLEHLVLSSCKSLIMLDLTRFPQLEELELDHCLSLTSLKCGISLPAIKEHDLAGCGQLEALPDLCNFVNLTYLSLSGCSSLVCLTNVGTFHKLEHLNLSSCKSMVMLDLAPFPQLKHLDLKDCTSLTSLKCGVPLLAHYWLDLSGCEQLEALDLAGCEQLKRLDLSNCKSMIMLDLTPFPQLEELKLGHCLSLTSLRCSVSLPAIKELDLGGCEQLEALPDLCTFVNLTHLVLSRCSSLVCLTNVGTFHKLEHLDLSSCKSMVMLDLAPFPQLKHLDLKDCTSLTSLKCGDPLLALYWLDLSGCEQLEALDLAGCEQLKRLYLSSYKSMDTLDLTPFPQLEKLELCKCSSLTSLRCSVPLLALKDLDLRGSKRLEALPDLCNFVNLEVLNLTGCSSLACLTSTVTLHSLKILKLWSCGSIGMLDLSTFPQVEEIELGEWLSLASLKCGVPLLALKELNLGGCLRLETLPDLCNFVNLEMLYLVGCSSLACLPSMGTLPSLKRMKLSNCGSIGMLDLTPFPQLGILELYECLSLACLTSKESRISLKCLSISICGSLGTLDLNPFSELEDLGVVDCLSLTSLSCSVPLRALKELDLRGCKRLNALPDLCNFVLLESLNLSGCWSLACLSTTGTLHSLKCLNLNLSSCGIMNTVDLSPFPQLAELKLSE